MISRFCGSFVETLPEIIRKSSYHIKRKISSEFSKERQPIISVSRFFEDTVIELENFGQPFPSWLSIAKSTTYSRIVSIYNG